MIYPFLWLVGSSFKTSYEIFSDPGFIPKHPRIDGYINGWKAAGGETFTTFYKNTLFYVLVKILFTLFATTITSYGFARFNFPFKKFLMAILIATLLFPGTVILVPSYLLFNYFRWVNSYLPLIIPSLFATDTFFVFMLIQFYRTIPHEMDEAALIDGCGSIRRLVSILIPLIKPALVTLVLFQFIWTSNDFMGPLIYISREKLYPISIGLRLASDFSEGKPAWENVMAMSMLAILPSLIVFIFAQKNFIEGIVTSGIKG
jgi:oligogalacturonide transport system permease protein